MTIVMWTRYWCQKGKAHRAYVHRNLGAAIIWCPRHGVLASMTHEFSERERSKRQMTGEEYRRFVGRNGAKRRRR